MPTRRKCDTLGFNICWLAYQCHFCLVNFRFETVVTRCRQFWPSFDNHAAYVHPRQHPNHRFVVLRNHTAPVFQKSSRKGKHLLTKTLGFLDERRRRRTQHDGLFLLISHHSLTKVIVLIPVCDEGDSSHVSSVRSYLIISHNLSQ